MILRQFRFGIVCVLNMIFLISQIDIEFLSTNNVLWLLLFVYWMKIVWWCESLHARVEQFPCADW